MIDHLKEICKHAVLFFYVDYQDRGQTYSSVVANLLKQLVSHMPGLPPELAELHDKYLLAVDATGSKTSELLELLFEYSAHFGSVYTIIDAFDECDREQQKDLLLFLRQVNLFNCSIRFILTSRPHLQCIQELSDSQATIPIKATVDDIGNFLASKLDSQTSLAPSVKDNIRLSLHEAAGEM